MNNKNYIILEENEHGYEIYVIEDGIKKRLKPQSKIIMHEVLKKFTPLRPNENTYVYFDYDLITQRFQKAKASLNRKKVNREKSQKIIAGFLIVTTILGSAYIVNKIANEDDSPSTKTEQTQNNPVDSLKPDDDYHEEENLNEFYYEFATPNDKEALINSKSYMETYKKYEKMYGVDADLLCAIGAQESSGVHHGDSTNNGYSKGIMGIEYIWDDAEIRVFNFEKNQYETIKVDYSRIGELDYNVKVGAAIFQNYFYNTLKNADDIDVEETDYLPFTLQKYNMGLGNMWTVLGYGGNWVDNRDMIDAGDKYYFEHVLSRLDNDTIIKLKLIDGSYYNTKLTNLSLEKHYSRN